MLYRNSKYIINIVVSKFISNEEKSNKNKNHNKSLSQKAAQMKPKENKDIINDYKNLNIKSSTQNNFYKNISNKTNNDNFFNNKSDFNYTKIRNKYKINDNNQYIKLFKQKDIKKIKMSLLKKNIIVNESSNIDISYDSINKKYLSLLSDFDELKLKNKTLEEKINIFLEIIKNYTIKIISLSNLLINEKTSNKNKIYSEFATTIEKLYGLVNNPELNENVFQIKQLKDNISNHIINVKDLLLNNKEIKNYENSNNSSSSSSLIQINNNLNELNSNKEILNSQNNEQYINSISSNTFNFSNNLVSNTNNNSSYISPQITHNLKEEYSKKIETIKKNYEDKINLLTQENNSLNEKINLLTKENEKLTQKNNDDKTDKNNESNVIKELQSQISFLQNENKILQEKCKLLNEENINIKNEPKDDNNNKDNIIKKLQNELNYKNNIINYLESLIKRIGPENSQGKIKEIKSNTLNNEHKSCRNFNKNKNIKKYHSYQKLNYNNDSAKNNLNKNKNDINVNKKKVEAQRTEFDDTSYLNKIINILEIPHINKYEHFNKAKNKTTNTLKRNFLNCSKYSRNNINKINFNKNNSCLNTQSNTLNTTNKNSKRRRLINNKKNESEDISFCTLCVEKPIKISREINLLDNEINQLQSQLNQLIKNQ